MLQFVELNQETPVKRSTSKRKGDFDEIYNEFISHFENGVFVYLTSDSAGRRMMEVAEQHLSGRSIYNLEAGLTYLFLALEEPDTVGEAAFGLWNVYLDEISDKETALQYLLTSDLILFALFYQ